MAPFNVCLLELEELVQKIREQMEKRKQELSASQQEGRTRGSLRSAPSFVTVDPLSAFPKSRGLPGYDKGAELCQQTNLSSSSELEKGHLARSEKCPRKSEDPYSVKLLKSASFCSSGDPIPLVRSNEPSSSVVFSKGSADSSKTDGIDLNARKSGVRFSTSSMSAADWWSCPNTKSVSSLREIFRRRATTDNTSTVPSETHRGSTLNINHSDSSNQYRKEVSSASDICCNATPKK